MMNDIIAEAKPKKNVWNFTQMKKSQPISFAAIHWKFQRMR